VRANGALASGDISVDEMMEAANHFACYAGMARGDLFDDTLWDVAAELGMKQTGSIDPSPLVFSSEAERLEAAAANIKDVMRPNSEVPLAGHFPASFTAPFVFADTWGRGGITRRERRLITLTCAAMSGVPAAPVSHWNAALASGALTIEELAEFWIHFHTYGGGPQAASLPTPSLPTP
jgi:4-carboxymuconolactone decarboxylase